MREDRKHPINAERANDRLAQINDPITRNLIGLGLGAVWAELMRPVGVSDAEWEARLPQSPIDLDFVARVLIAAYGDREVVDKILAGTSIEAASGWLTRDELKS